MSTILLTYRKPSDQSKILMSHQAFAAAVRSMLAERRKIDFREISEYNLRTSMLNETLGMTRSAHKILVPANINILPLLVTIANDYTAFVEPESDERQQPAPFILYWENETESDISMIEEFAQPAWFEDTGEHLSMQEIIRSYRPEYAMLIGGIPVELNVEDSSNSSIRRMIAISNLMGEGEQFKGGDMPRNMLMADHLLDDAIGRGLSDRNTGDKDQLSAWDTLQATQERKPELETFMAFGIAFEMAMFIS